MSRKQRVSYRVENIEPIAAGEITNEKQITVYNPERKEDFQATVGGLKSVFGGEDNTTEPNFPYKRGNAFEDSNLSQDPDGKLRASTEIIAEAGIDTVSGTVSVGDGLDEKGRTGQQINVSNSTGNIYQIPYQEVDKTGSEPTFQTDIDPEIVNDIRQAIFDTVMVSPLVFTETPIRNEIINKIYVRSDGDVINFRYQVKSNQTGKIIDSYPDKFSYEKDEGVDLTGAGIHEIDIYYPEDTDATPNEFLLGQTFEITIQWDTGNILGNSSNVPYYAYDYQAFEFVDIINEFDSVTKLSDVNNAGSGSIMTDIERAKLNGIEDGAEVNVQSDWTQTDNTQDDYIKNKTKELLINPTNGNSVEVGNWNVERLDSTSDTHFKLKLCGDFGELVSAVVHIIPDATETINWNAQASITAVGKHYNDVENFQTSSKAVTVNIIDELDISSLFAGVSNNDLVAIDFNSDTTYIRVIGLAIVYKCL